MLLLGGALVSCAGKGAEPLRGYAVDVWKSDNGLPQNTAAAITQSADGFLWIGTQGGLARFDGSSFKILTRQSGPGLVDTEVRHLLAASDGSLWISTGGGLCRINQGKITGQDSREAVLARKGLLFEDSRKQVYVAGETGLLLWRTGWNFTPAIGLADKHVTAIAEDSGGRIWLGTQNGLCELRGARWTRYRRRCGISRPTLSMAIAKVDSGWAAPDRYSIGITTHYGCCPASMEYRTPG
jgi:ligand-binding sensor domain-containing protein